MEGKLCKMGPFPYTLQTG